MRIRFLKDYLLDGVYQYHVGNIAILDGDIACDLLDDGIVTRMPQREE